MYIYTHPYSFCITHTPNTHGPPPLPGTHPHSSHTVSLLLHKYIHAHTFPQAWSCSPLYPITLPTTTPQSHSILQSSMVSVVWWAERHIETPAGTSGRDKTSIQHTFWAYCSSLQLQGALNRIIIPSYTHWLLGWVKPVSHTFLNKKAGWYGKQALQGRLSRRV